MATLRHQPRNVPDLTYIEYFILLSIVKNSLAGIGIFEHLVRETDSKLVLSPGTLYTALKRMLAHKLIEMVEPNITNAREGDPRRKSYRATPQGREKILEMKRWFQRELEAVDEAFGTPLPHSIDRSAEEPGQGGSRTTDQQQEPALMVGASLKPV